MGPYSLYEKKLLPGELLPMVSGTKKGWWGLTNPLFLSRVRPWRP
jgi:hypothetical protein